MAEIEDSKTRRPAQPRRSRTVLRGVVVLACALGGSVATPAQAKKFDARDRLTLMTGKTLRGRVVSRYGQRVLLVQGGKRHRFTRREVRSVHTINDEISQFFAYRDAIGSHPKRKWILVEWAASKGLNQLARLQALSIVLADPNAERARVYLGHKRVPGGWRWPVDGRYVTLAAANAHHEKWGRARTLRGEHFVFKTNGDLGAAVDALFDLERLYLFWEETFGEALDMREALQPIEIRAWSRSEDFPKISALELPYYGLQQDAAFTFFRPGRRRPEGLFAVATQALIYRTWVEGRAQFQNQHLCAWAEIGLGQWVEAAFRGKPGRAAPVDRVRLDPVLVADVLRRRPKLNRVIHVPHELFYELSRRVSARWSSTEALVHYLMSQRPDPTVRKRFLAYLVAVFRKGLGDSSTAFDRALGEPVEDLQPKFEAWLRTRR